MRKIILFFATCAFLAPLLSGCVAAAFVPLVPLVTGTQEAGVLVTVDPSTLKQSTRNALFNAKLLGIVSIDRASIKAADLFETKGGYSVKIDRVAAKQGEMTGSERRESLANLCSARGVDVAMLGHITKTETNNTAIAALTGRAKTNMAWTMDVMTCNSRMPDSFGGTLEIDMGIYNGNQAKLEEAMGAELGDKILAAIGRTRASSAERITDDVVATPSATLEKSSFDANASKTTTVGATNPGVVAESMTSSEIQKKLIDLGYLRGRADGVMGKNSVDALKKFQQDNGLLTTGKANRETIARLSIAKLK